MIRHWDQKFLLSILFLMGLGLVQIYSSSFIFAIDTFGDGLFFFRKQLAFAFIGLIALFFMGSLSWGWAQRLGVALALVSIGALALTYVPGLAIKAGGAHRWLQLPLGQRFEPSELLKVTYPFLLAWVLTSEKRQFGDAEWPVRVGILLLPLVLLLGQPDFGSFVICGALALGTWFIFGLPLKYIFMALLVSFPAFYYLVIQVPYRYARIVAFLDPWSDPSHKGFQVIQSMLSIHSGGIWGSGLGQGQGKLFFLPEAHTDFTLAVLGEELGFLGLFFVLSLYGYVILRSLQISMKAEKAQHRAIAFGLSLVFAFQTFINMGVALGLLPTKGLTLPFLSYGGSSLICTCLAMGWLLNLDVEIRKGNVRKVPFNRNLRKEKTWQTL